jgi:hypothetical protein
VRARLYSCCIARPSSQSSRGGGERRGVSSRASVFLTLSSAHTPIVLHGHVKARRAVNNGSPLHADGVRESPAPIAHPCRPAMGCVNCLFTGKIAQRDISRAEPCHWSFMPCCLSDGCFVRSKIYIFVPQEPRVSACARAKLMPLRSATMPSPRRSDPVMAAGSPADWGSARGVIFRCHNCHPPYLHGAQ